MIDSSAQQERYMFAASMCAGMCACGCCELFAAQSRHLGSRLST